MCTHSLMFTEEIVPYPNEVEVEVVAVFFWGKF